MPISASARKGPEGQVQIAVMILQRRRERMFFTSLANRFGLDEDQLTVLLNKLLGTKINRHMIKTAILKRAEQHGIPSVIQTLEHMLDKRNGSNPNKRKQP
jgi:hypothetical protein